jgi:hypothetical protein
LVQSLQRLIEQSTETLGPEDPSTLMLKQQLAAALASQGRAPKVVWLKPAPDGPGPEELKS